MLQTRQVFRTEKRLVHFRREVGVRVGGVVLCVYVK